MPSRPSYAFAVLYSLLFLIGPALPAEFSRSEWIDPGQAGSALWIRNGGNRAVSLDAFFVRTLGFQGFAEVAFDAGPRRLQFAVHGDARGHWARLVPWDRRPVWLRAHDSLMLSGFACGARLRAGQDSRRAAEEFVLDLKVVDSRGDTSRAKVVQLAPQYRIPDQPGMADSGPGE